MAWKNHGYKTIPTTTSLLLSPISLHRSGRGAVAIFNPVLLPCLMPLLLLLVLLSNYSSIKGGFPPPNPNTHLSPQCPYLSTLFIHNIPTVGTTFPLHPSYLIYLTRPTRFTCQAQPTQPVIHHSHFCAARHQPLPPAHLISIFVVTVVF